ncbi:helicase [Oceanobacillus manasiensis]|uniref:helicase n=1 Tax=Oceanobacillus manasiensis TaxID=586413 RepID=UPI0015960BEC|nr:helicase [Oceanobacillus manasiensis]
MRIFPDCSFITRTIEMGGLTKSQLNYKLQQHSISMNEFAEILIADEKFTASNTRCTVKTVELTVMDLGFPKGATLPEIFGRVSELGLGLCPVELGPYLRLYYLNQPEGYKGKHIQPGQAPTGSITIASEVIREDDEYPKGFYLRNINGVLWLRGYVADDLHVWNPEDHFVFLKSF